MKALGQLFNREEGQALVELALVLPILLLLIFGCVEFGRIFGTHLLINNLARDAARYGVVGHSDSEINDLIISNSAWLDEDNLLITIKPSYNDREKGEALDVKVDYSLNLLTPVIAEILDNPLPLSGQCIMRIE